MGAFFGGKHGFKDIYKMKISIIDYRAGNSSSVMRAVERLGFEAGYAKAPKDLEGATHIILPGVGAAGATMDSLRESGILEALQDAVIIKKKLFMGICIGMQILFERSEEGDTPCLGWLKGDVAKFDTAAVRVPQIGWNYVRFVKESSLSVRDGYYYFVNSYHVRPQDKNALWAVSDYGGQFAAAIAHENIFATQFHAEKSGEVGLKLLKGFLTLKG